MRSWRGLRAAGGHRNPPDAARAAAPRRHDPLRRFARTFFRHRGAVFGLTILTCWVAVALFAPVLAPRDPLELGMAGRVGPSPEHPLGTDRLGRDILSRIMYGARISLLLGVVSVTIGLSVGSVIGVVAGYVGGRLETLLMRFIDALLAFPGVLLALVVIAALGPSLTNVMIAVGIASIPEYARLARASTLSVKARPFIEAARANGADDARIMLRHLAPNIAGPLIVLSTLQVGTAILVGSGLSFLGMGAQPPTPEWGLMTANGRDYLDRAWWMSTFPGLAILTTVVAFNLVGDGLKEALDPHGRGR
jgi:peptide/nickel transport system permease protein